MDGKAYTMYKPSSKQKVIFSRPPPPFFFQQTYSFSAYVLELTQSAVYWCIYLPILVTICMFTIFH